MKALIFSDSHGYLEGMFDAIDKNPDAQLIIHAGDVQRDVDDLMSVYPSLPCAYVIGNNDYFVHNEPYDRFFEFGGKKIFLTHGHNYGVKMSAERVRLEAKRTGADICIFGHTHAKHLSFDDIWLVNPGAAYKSYAVLVIKNGECSIKIEDI